MRLAQLARKIDLRPSDVVEFLASHRIHIVDASNTRLEDDQVLLIMNKFAPHLIQEIPSIETLQQEEDTIEPHSDELIASETTSVPVIAPKVQEALSTELPEEESEVIKAPKIALSGLKVLGKIELP